jgi:uncharacterized protein with HEPN domain
MSFESRDYLRHMLVEADYLIGRSAGLSYEAFAADETLRRAFVRSLEIIGEAAKKVPMISGRCILQWSGAQWPACGIA